MANNFDQPQPAAPPRESAREELCQLLEQALSAERRRWRRDYVRLAGFFLLLFLAFLVGGSVLAHRLLAQLRLERQISQYSATGRQGIPAASYHLPPLAPDQTEALPLAPDAATTAKQAAIQRLLTDLEAKTQSLTNLLASGNVQTKELLKSREGELRELHQHLDAVQRQLMNASQAEATASAKQFTAP
ncbi:MAG: hypothetical protein HYV35_00075 [Lentisphaerae bacterium]|nr:hypothetical protein [Lentisphaerota bacterium]